MIPERKVARLADGQLSSFVKSNFPINSFYGRNSLLTLQSNGVIELSKNVRNDSDLLRDGVIVYFTWELRDSFSFDRLKKCLRPELVTSLIELVTLSKKTGYWVKRSFVLKFFEYAKVKDPNLEDCEILEDAVSRMIARLSN